MRVFLSMMVAFCVVGSAGPITYVEQGSESGSLGGVSFTNALVTITVTGDTGMVLTPIGSPGLFEDLGTATVSVAGIGTATFTDQMEAFDSQTVDWAGISDHSHSDLITLVTVNPLFASYTLATGIGPVSGSTMINSAQSFPTTAGSLILNSVTGNSTFSATVPEPGSFVSLAIGLGLIFALPPTLRKTLV